MTFDVFTNSSFSIFPEVPLKASVTLFPKSTPAVGKLTDVNVKFPCVGTLLVTCTVVALICVAVIVEVSTTPDTAPCALETVGLDGRVVRFAWLYAAPDTTAL